MISADIDRNQRGTQCKTWNLGSKNVFRSVFISFAVHVLLSVALPSRVLPWDGRL